MDDSQQTTSDEGLVTIPDGQSDGGETFVTANDFDILGMADLDT